ncbi:tyrosine-type recombinase/integrase [Butyrivibrio proteoclasticus]|uniref:tyrosine-type recombinase/integrase n=1 Tax=Butyrivibrio proteoclasticus TaxID=43305 RepID=UPI00047DB4ED|nr:tyrosine-type recombinase/integrase [Butyrivibrio proteoclasticus]
MRNFSEVLSEDFKRYFMECTMNMNSRTRDEYISYINLLVNRQCKDFIDITEEDARSYFNYLGSKLDSGSMTRKTVGVRLSCFRTIASFLEDKIEEYRNPFINIVRPEISPDINPNRIPSMEELDMLMSASRTDPKSFLIMALATRMGLSVTSILSLNRGSIVKEGSITYLYFASKNDFKGNSYIPVPEDVAVILDDYVSQLSDEDNVLFKNKRGNRMNLQNVDKIVRDLVKTTGIKTNYTMKDFRNRAILEMAAHGASLNDLKAYTGLSDVRLDTFMKHTDYVSTHCPANLVNYRLILN